MERRKMLKNITVMCRKHKNKNNVKVNYWNLEISTLKSRKSKEESNSRRNNDADNK